MFHNPLGVVPIWYVPACYSIRLKHLQRMDTTVLELNVYFLSTVLISILPMRAVSHCDTLYYKCLHCKYFRKKRSWTYNVILKGWKTLFLIRLLSLKNSILLMRGNTSDWASGRRDGIQDLRTRDWQTKENVQFVALLNRGFQGSASDCYCAIYCSLPLFLSHNCSFWSFNFLNSCPSSQFINLRFEWDVLLKD